MRRALACVGAVVAVLGSPPEPGWARGVAHVELIYGAHFRHIVSDTLFISHNGFFPPAYCRKKVKFWLYDGGGRKFYLGKKKAYAKPRYFVKRLPSSAKPGRGKIKGKQNCGRIRGTATDTDSLVIAASGPAPRLGSDRIARDATGRVVTNQIEIALTKWDFHFLTVRVEYEVLPGVWQQVAVLGRDRLVRKPGPYEIPWRTRVGGKPAPAGTYRFVFEFFHNAYESGRGMTPRAVDTTEFQVYEVLGEGVLAGAVDGAVNPFGEVVVADRSHNRLAVFDEAGRLARTVGGTDDLLDGPTDVAFDGAGFQYVADTDNGRITKLTSAGALVDTFGEPRHQFGGPTGIDVTTRNGGRVYSVVGRRGTPCVIIYDLEGNHVADVVHEPCDSPSDVAAAPDGSLWVADSGADQLFHFDADGNYMGVAQSTTTGGLVPLSIRHQTSVDVAPDGRLHLGARLSSPPAIEFGAVVTFGADGSYQHHFGDDEIGYVEGVIAAGLAGDVYLLRRQASTLRLRFPH